MGTLLAIGAHYDDCVFGIPGILLQAVQKHYRVVIAALIGDYTNWSPVRGREKEFLEKVRGICRNHGAEMRFLDFASHRFEVNAETKRAVARLVADVAPDIGFVLWDRDQHRDHVVASELSQVALRFSDRILDNVAVRPPRAIYAFDNGPRHTIGFEPNTWIDISDVWPAANDWLGQLMAATRNEPYRAGQWDAAQRAKEALSRYRGAACGVQYAEALWAPLPRPEQIL